MPQPSPLSPLLDNPEFSAVTLALLHIYSADYGLCVDCQRSIAFEHLQREAQTLRCPHCQTLYERTH